MPVDYVSPCGLTNAAGEKNFWLNLANLLIGDEASFVMNGEVNTQNVPQYMRQKDTRLHSILKGAILESTLRSGQHFVETR